MEIPSIFQHLHDPGLSDHFQRPPQTSPHFNEGPPTPEDEAFAVMETLQRMRKAGQVLLFESKMGNTYVSSEDDDAA